MTGPAALVTAALASAALAAFEPASAWDRSLVSVVEPAHPRGDTVPQDTYADSGTRELIERARAARGSEAEGLDSYEALLKERLYVGLSGLRFRRERGLFRSERVARVRWSSDGRETIRWLGMRHEIPIVGDAADPELEDDDRDIDDFPLDPTADRLMLGGSPWLHPLADTASLHYRYSSGDTLRVILPATGREITLVEIRLEPRRADFGLLAGSVWFDHGSAALVRGAFRPAREFNLELDEPEDAEGVPRFLKPITVAVEHMIVDYALRELEWWLPHRLRFEGQARAGRLLRVPVAIELEADEFRINEADELDPGEEGLPDGWRRIVVSEDPDDGDADEQDREPVERVIILPPADSLRASPYLSDEPFGAEPVAFGPRELAGIQSVLEEAAELPPLTTPAFWQLGMFRFNRVEGLSAGARRQGPLFGRVVGRAELRLGVADLIPNAELAASRDFGTRALEGEAYYRLQAANDWGDPFNIESSVNALIFGYDDGQYYRAGGASVTARKESGKVRYEVRGFLEAHWSAEKNTDLSISHIITGDDAFSNISANEIEIAGVSGRATIQSGIDPRELISTVTAWGEAGAGGAEYGRLAAQAMLSHPLFWRLAGTIEYGAGTTFGNVPTQRLYFLGGPQTLRAFPGGALSGEAFWLARAEVAYGHPAVRLVVFGDLGWAGDRGEFATSQAAVSAGIGASLLDGILRVDIARALRGRDPLRTRVHIYFDGLF